MNNRSPIATANAIVTPQAECGQELVVSIRLLNLLSQAVSIYKGTKIAQSWNLS